MRVNPSCSRRRTSSLNVIASPPGRPHSDARPATLTGLEGYQQQPWDQRAKGVIDAFGKALAQRKVPEPPAAALNDAPAPAPEPRGRMIRIYRGTQWSLAN